MHNLYTETRRSPTGPEYDAIMKGENDQDLDIGSTDAHWISGTGVSARRSEKYGQLRATTAVYQTGCSLNQV